MKNGQPYENITAVNSFLTHRLLNKIRLCILNYLKFFGKQTIVSSYRLAKRGGIGVINMKTTDKTGKVVAAFPVDDDSEIMIITQQAKLIRLGVDKIRETGRSAQGVTLIKTGDDDQVTSASLLAVEAEEEE